MTDLHETFFAVLPRAAALCITGVILLSLSAVAAVLAGKKKKRGR